jgi:hypothetical protein
MKPIHCILSFDAIPPFSKILTVNYRISKTLVLLFSLNYSGNSGKNKKNIYFYTFIYINSCRN